MLHPVWPMAVLLAACGLAACAGPDHGPASAPAGEAPRIDEPVRWPYWPTAMRIHPLSRLVTDDATGTTVLEARIELLDREHDTTKGVGVLELELRDASGRADIESTPRWERDLADPALNRLHYDDVTRTYLLRLELEPEQIPPRPVLWARFTSADGQVFGDHLAIRTK